MAPHARHRPPPPCSVAVAAAAVEQQQQQVDEERMPLELEDNSRSSRLEVLELVAAIAPVALEPLERVTEPHSRRLTLLSCFVVAAAAVSSMETPNRAAASS